nr:hypothetical protein [Apis mellifera nudivirus]
MCADKTLSAQLLASTAITTTTSTTGAADNTNEHPITIATNERDIVAWGNKKSNECVCERNLSDADRVKCFVSHYARFQARRCNDISRKELDELNATKRVCDLRIAEFTCRNTSEELALALILYSFLENYCKTHPRFAIEVPFGNCFKGKINFFNNI